MAASPGGALPGAGVPLALPDLQGAARAAMASVVERAPAPSPAPTRGPAPTPAYGPSVVELAERAREELSRRGMVEGDRGAPIVDTAPTGAIGHQTPHVAPAPTPDPQPPPMLGRTPLRVPPPPPGWAPLQHAARRLPAPRVDTSSWPGGEVGPRERDAAQRVGDALYPLVRRVRDSRLGIVGVIALFGITVPIILLRQSFDVRARIVGGIVVFWFWIALLSEIG
jgi:hypothetical protein